MNCCRRCLHVLLWVLVMSALLLACGDDGGSSATPESACNHYCSCSFAAMIPNCQSTCVTGINMAPNPGACARCTNDSSCAELEQNACKSACQP